MLLKQKQGSGKDCFICGVSNPIGLHLNFYEFAPGEVESSFLPTEEYQGYPGLLHGGIAASILDETAGRSLMGIDFPRFMFTAKLEVKYRRNVPIGKPVNIVGKAGQSHGRVARAWAGIYSEEGELLVEADVVLVDVPESQASTDLEESGWKVYPDERKQAPE